MSIQKIPGNPPPDVEALYRRLNMYEAEALSRSAEPITDRILTALMKTFRTDAGGILLRVDPVATIGSEAKKDIEKTSDQDPRPFRLVKLVDQYGVLPPDIIENDVYEDPQSTPNYLHEVWGIGGNTFVEPKEDVGVDLWLPINGEVKQGAYFLDDTTQEYDVGHLRPHLDMIAMRLAATLDAFTNIRANRQKIQEQFHSVKGGKIEGGRG